MNDEKTKDMREKVNQNKKQTDDTYDNYQKKLDEETKNLRGRKFRIDVNNPKHWVAKTIITVILAIGYTYVINMSNITPPILQVILVIVLTVVSSTVFFQAYDEFVVNRASNTEDETDILRTEFIIMKEQYKELKKDNDLQKRLTQEMKQVLESATDKTFEELLELAKVEDE